ncbi:MAG TPA: DNA-binding protein Alba [Geobacterales bacterium]|nr:DNA-binding protein Alba [Geobacterales bacterium]
MSAEESRSEGVPVVGEQEKRRTAIPENTVLIGKKPIMGYVVATLMQFQRGSSKAVLKARGSNISRAVDVVEILKNKFLPGAVAVSKIEIGTERVGEGEKARDVSIIEIHLEKVK